MRLPLLLGPREATAIAPAWREAATTTAPPPHEATATALDLGPARLPPPPPDLGPREGRERQGREDSA
jgi:hypothetical protein